MSFRTKYWSSNSLIDKLRARLGHEKPHCATAEDWKAWKIAYKAAYPKLYWFTEEFANDLQDIVCWPLDFYRKVFYALNARFKDRYWCLGSTLNKWKYHEIDTRMLECNFEALRVFVEEEKASLNLVSWEGDNFIDNSKKFGKKWYHNNRIISLFAPQWKSREAGLEHLEWERNLLIDDDYLGNHEPAIQEAKKNGTYKTKTLQAVKAEKILELYLWWVDIRPNRPDPHDVSGLTEYYRTKIDLHDMLSNESLNDITRNKMYDVCGQLEEEYYQEDTEMLVKLVQLRQGLWT